MGTGVGQQLEQRLVFLPLGRCFYHSTNLMAQKAGVYLHPSHVFSALSSWRPLNTSIYTAHIHLGLSLFMTHPAASVHVIPCSCCGFCKPPRGGDVFVTDTQSPGHVHQQASDQGSGSQGRTSDGQATPNH